MAEEVLLRLRSEGAREVASELGGLEGTLGRLNGRKYNVDTAPARRSLTQLGTDIDRTGKKMTEFGSRSTRWVTAPIAGGLALATKSFIDFDDAMNQSLAIQDKVQPRIRKQMEKTARTTAIELNMSARDTAEAYFFLASAGLKAEQQIAALPAVARFAKAGMFDMATATSLAANAQSALGLKVKDPTQNLKNMVRVTDALTQANILADGEIQDFAEALTTKAATALRIVNKPVEEGVAVLAAYAEQGVKGKIAGEQLSIVLREMRRAALDNKGEFGEFGVAVFDVNGKMRNTADILADVEGALKGKSDAEKQATLTTLGFTAETQSALLTLVGMSGQIKEYQASIEKAGGVTKNVADKQMVSLKQQLGQVRRELEDAGLSLGETFAPGMLAGAEAAGELVGWLTKLPGPAKVALGAMVGLAAVVGPLSLLVGGTMRGVGGLLKGMGKIGSLGKAGGGGALGKAAGGMGGVQKVWVVNMGGGAGGLGGGAAGSAGRFGRLGALARAPIGGPLALGAAAIGGGMALNALDKRFHFMSPDPQETRKQVQAAQNAMIDAWRQGGPRVEEAIRKAMGPMGGFTKGETIREWQDAARKGVNAFAGQIDRSKTGVKRSFNEVATAALQQLDRLPPQAQKLAADSMVRMSRTLENNGKLPKGSTERLVKAIEQKIGTLPGATRTAAAGMAASFGELQQSLRGVMSDIDALNASVRASGRPLSQADQNRYRQARDGLASGGYTPGHYTGRDPLIARLDGNEAVLNPRQQAMVPGGRATLTSIFRQTGGKMGGHAFASGGYTQPFPGGSWAGGPSAHAARALGNWQSDNAWDIMGGSGAMTYAVLPGTIGRISASDRRGQFAGQGVYLHTADGTWWYKHVSARVSSGQKVQAGDPIGTLVSWTNGGPHLHLATDRGDPARARSGALPGKGGDEREGGDSGGSGGGSSRPLSPRQKAAKLLRGVFGGGLKGVGEGIGPGSSRAGAIARGVPDFSGSALGASLSDKQTRAVDAAGRSAAAGARKAGLSPDLVEKASNDAERNGELFFLRKNLKDAKTDRGKLEGRKRSLLGELRRIQKAKPGKPGAKKAAARAVRLKLREVTREINELNAVIAEVQSRLDEIGEDQAQEQYQVDYEAGQAGTTGTGTSDTGSGLGSGEDAARADREAARAAVAERQAGLSESALRTFLGPGDISSGGRTATEAAGGMVVVPISISSLTPDGPSTLAAIGAAVSSAFGAQGASPSKTVDLKL